MELPLLLWQSIVYVTRTIATYTNYIYTWKFHFFTSDITYILIEYIQKQF